MSVYHQIFQLSDRPMVILMQNKRETKIEDANVAFVRLTGYRLPEMQARANEHITQRYFVDPSQTLLKSEVVIYTKKKKPVSIRVNQQPLPAEERDDARRSLIIIEDLSAYKWIEKQCAKNKVLISGTLDCNQHIRFLRDSLAPLLFEPDNRLEDETLMAFIADADHERLKKALHSASRTKKEGSLKLQTSKLSGIELELSITFAPILDGFDEVKEFAFVILDLKPVDDKISASMKLKIWMAKRDMSAAQLSIATGISIQTISKLRNGKIKKPQRLTAELIASELQVEIGEIWDAIRK
ncbi:helix-turn-helix domain-containing protein [Paenibacillus arenilitoris]|uniref:Helix-turn-helix transcriptional regulator n=1 Tax=Paenibacillus arenilitoris TaxID=2772299 RepID=A0A927CNR2_9BACL|nr:helix-turn-helix transcriptional regulator [Paenibacillus arenilitoris]MBD2869511.1 helix-turn-helix transcriptional regulator [Paenibacillus arenilitoris]